MIALCEIPTVFKKTFIVKRLESQIINRPKQGSNIGYDYQLCVCLTIFPLCNKLVNKKA